MWQGVSRKCRILLEREAAPNSHGKVAWRKRGAGTVNKILLGWAFPGCATCFPCFSSSGSGQLPIVAHSLQAINPAWHHVSRGNRFWARICSPVLSGRCCQLLFKLCWRGRRGHFTQALAFSEMPASLHSREAWAPLVSHTQHPRRVFSCYFESICSPRCRWEEQEELAALKHLRRS